MDHPLKTSILAFLLLALAADPSPAALVSGHVLDPSGSPAAGVNLDFVDKATGTNLPLTGDVTDALGAYAVTVPAGSYEVRYKPPLGQPWAPARERTVRVPADLALPDFRLLDGWAVTGTLVDEAGAPVPGADLNFLDAFSGAALYTIRDNTDAVGVFSVLVPCGTYDVTFNPPVGHPDAARRINGVDVPCSGISLGTVSLVRGAVLQGVVREAATGLPVADADMDIVDPATGRQIPTPRDNTDAAGFYQVLVPPGTWTVQAEPPQGSRVLPGEVQGVVVAGTTVQDLLLGTGALLFGTVTSAADGTPIEGVDLNVYDGVTSAPVDTPTDNTDYLGRYSVALAPGLYQVDFRPPGGGPFLPLRFANETIAGDMRLDAALPAGLRLTGRVLRALDGTPVVDTDIDVNDPLTVPFFTPFDNTGPDGRFVVTVRAGTGYSVDIEPTDTFAPRRIQPVDVLSDWTDLGDILLEDGVEVSGRVLRRSDRSPVPDANTIYREALGGLTFTTADHTGPDGVFRVWIPEGDYAVEVDPGTAVPLAPQRIQPVAAALPGPVDLGDILLDDATLVTGRVVEAGTGAPLTGIDLDVNDASLGSLFLRHDKTAADGTFAMRVVPGSYLLDLEPPAGDPHVGRNLDVVLAMPSTDLGTMELAAGAFVRGRALRAADSTPVAGVDVDVNDPVLGRLFTPHDKTDTQGRFEVVAPVRAGYSVDLEPVLATGLAPVRIKPVDLVAPATDLGDIFLAGAVILQGTVRDPGGIPYPGADLDVLEAGTANKVFIKNDVTDASGFYQVAVAAGTYDVRIQPPRGSNLGWETTTAVAVQTSPTVVDFDLIPLLTGIAPASGPAAGGTPLTLTGNRFDALGTAALGGSPLEGMVVSNPSTLTGISGFHAPGLVDAVFSYPTGELGILRAAFEYLTSPTPTILFVERMDQNVLLTWTDSGQSEYVAARSAAPDFSSPTVVFRGAGTQALDGGAVGAGGLVFYGVQ